MNMLENSDLRPVLRGMRAVAGAAPTGMLCALVALLVPLLPPLPGAVSPAVAQQAKSGQSLASPRPGSTVKAQFGDWKHECSRPPGARLDLCAITQDVSDESNSDIGVSVHVQKLPSGESILRVIAPLGVLLTHNLAVKVDGDFLGEAPFLRCYVLGCQAQIEIDDKLRGRLTGGKTMLLVIHRTVEQGVGIPISLNGFAQALAALK